MAFTLGIDLGGTKLLGCLLDSAGQPISYLRRPSGRAFGPDQLVREVVEIASAAKSQGIPVVGLGVGFPGLVNRQKGVALSSVILDGWNEVPLAQQLSQASGLPCVIDNDVNNAVRAELNARSSDTSNDMLFVAVGTGIGGAIVLDGRIWTGTAGLAGEIGHMSVQRDGPVCVCGRRGCIGAVASGSSIEEQSGISPGTLVEAASRGEPRVLAAIERAADLLGSALANALNLLNLPLVVLGGGVSEVGATYLSAVRRAVHREAFPEIAADCQIELSRAGYNAGAVGAALLAMESAQRLASRADGAGA